jgi:hypothetical protein
MWESLRDDLAYATRGFRRSPGLLVSHERSRFDGVLYTSDYFSAAQHSRFNDAARSDHRAAE